MVRAIAALLVMVGHARGYYFPEYAAVEAPGIATRAFYFVTGLQHEGVVLFFLVSGFLVGGGVWSALAARRFDAARYLSNRLVRIYLVLVPALLLTLAIYGLGKVWLPEARSFAGLPAQPWSWQSVLCHLGCLQGIACSVVAGNAPLWSLSYEWLLYLAAPLVIGLGYAPVDRPWRLAGGIVLFSIIAAVAPAHLIWSWVAIWFSGAAAARVGSVRPLPAWLGAAGAVATMTALAASRLRIVPQIGTDLLAAAAFATMLASPRALSFSIAPRWFRFMADASYSLYAIHLPVLLLAVALVDRLMGIEGTAASSRNAAAFLLVSLSCVAAAVAFAMVTERHTRTIQRAAFRR